MDVRLKARRLRAGLSQGDLAEQAGLTRQAIGAIEGGRYVPNTLVALKLASILGCRVEELFALPEALEEREVEVIEPWAARQAGETGAYGPERVVVAHARGRWVAHPLRARRGLHEAFASADGVVPALADRRPSAGSGRTEETSSGWAEEGSSARTA